MGVNLGVFPLLLLLVSPSLALITHTPVSELLTTYSSDIQTLKSVASPLVDVSHEPYSNHVFFLRYCLEYDDEEERKKNILNTLQWRNTAGKDLCDRALQAVKLASSDGDIGNAWNNAPVVDRAPFGDTICMYLTPRNVLTTTFHDDLVYCIRAGQIDDNALMNKVTIDQMADFFLYAKEVNALVANKRSLHCDKLLSIITVNDLTGIKLLGGSADFRKALSVSSKQANDLYPSTAGPTLLLNLPPILNALVKLFTPLFPPKVNARLKFASSPCFKECQTLFDIAVGGKDWTKFMQELENILG